MSGVLIVGELLRGDAFLTTEFVAAERIKAGRLPDSSELPALLVRSVSTVDRLFLNGKPFVRERVSVTVRASSYREQRLVIAAVRNACGGRRGTIAGFASVSVLSAGAGPDLDGPGNSFERSQDFRVSFEEPA